MTTKQALITFLAVMVTVPCMVYALVHLVLWMGGMR